MAEVESVVLDAGPDSDRDPAPVESIDGQVRGVVVDLIVPESFLPDGFASVEWVGEPSVDSVDGPFGRFGSCSGWRETVSAYSVVVSTGVDESGSDDLAAVLIWTSDRVEGAGAYDAEVRLERVDGTAWDGSGTMELSPDLVSGRIAATSPDGTRIEGSFECSGSSSPVPVGATGVVEVFALIRSGEAERVLGLVTAETAAARCAGSDGPASVTASVDPGAGGLGSFEIGGEPTPTVRFEAGGVRFEVDDPMLSLIDGGVAGVFAGTTADGIEVDGAFRCS